MGFFDKLKMGSEEAPLSEDLKQEEPKKKTAKRPKTEKVKIEPRVELETEPKEKKESPQAELEGELAIDVYETDGDFVIQSTIAGVKAEDLDITIENDIVTVKGSREKQTTEETKKYYYQECYWGTFQRQVILPEEVDGSQAEAKIKDGVLTLRIPKIIKIQKRKISIKQEE